MDSSKDMSLLLKEEEWDLLLAGEGAQTWYGIAAGDGIKSKNEIYRTLAALYQKGHVDWPEKKVCIKEPVKSMITIAGKAKYCMIVTKESESTSYYFFRGKVLKVSRDHRQPKRMCCTLFTKEELLKYLEEEGYLGTKGADLPETENGNIAFLLKEKNYLEEISRFSFVSVKDGKQLESFEIGKAGIFTFISFEDSYEKKIPYQNEWCIRKLNEWMRR